MCNGIKPSPAGSTASIELSKYDLKSTLTAFLRDLYVCKTHKALALEMNGIMRSFLRFYYNTNTISLYRVAKRKYLATGNAFLYFNIVI